MAHVQEHDMMIHFYLSTPSVQQGLLEDYQQLGGNLRKRLTFLDFLKENLETRIVLDQMYSNMTIQTFPQISV